MLDSTVVFNELMYHPVGDEDALEWIELYNQLNVDMDISRWRLSGAVDYQFDEGTTISGRSHLVVGINPQELEVQTGFSAALGPYSGRLSNGGEQLELVNNNDRLMSVLDYRDGGQWPVGPDGVGFTLAKRDELLSTREPEKWTTSQQVGGTPGEVNFVATTGPELVISEVAPGGSVDFFVEIANETGSSQPVAGHVIVSSTGAEYVIPVATIAPGAHLSVDASELGFTPSDGDELFLLSPGRSQLLDARRVTGSLRGLSPQHDGRWLYPSTATPGAANSFQFEDDIVINEIFYHPFGQRPANIDPTDLDTLTSVTLVTNGAEGSVLIPSNDSLGNSWQQPGFNDSTWTSGPTGVGFELSAVSSAIAYGNLAGASGSFSLRGPYGHDFTVNSTITVTELGVFDSGADGLSRTLTAELWSRENDTTGTELTQLTFTTADPGTLVGSNRFKPLATPVVLAPGQYTMVAHGFGSDEKAGHQDFGGPSQTFKTLDDGIGAISFVGQSRLGSTPGQFPTLLAGGDVNHFSAGTFRFDSGGFVDSQVTTDIEAQMHGVNASAYVRMEFTATAPDPDQFAELTLKMKHDDGYIAYLNGTEVARRNAPASVTFNSSATIAEEMLLFQELDISSHVDKLQTGNNVLAIHGLNFDANDPDFLIVPELQLETAFKPQDEWIELYNRSTTTVDLTGWQLDDGISFDFPAGTSIAPDGYLVVAQDAARLAAIHPSINVVGNFSGLLSNRDDLIQLIDANKNPADEVHYYQDGYWPKFADGGGSSLELRDVRADNSKPGAWDISEESSKSTWNSYSYRGIANPFESDGLQYHELVIGLLDDGEILVDDITVIEDPDGSPRQLIQNSNFESDSIGSEASTWRIYGNHFGKVVVDPEDASNQVLHLRATGTTEDMHNHGETTFKSGSSFVQIVPGREYEISYRAKWLGGTNLFNTRLYYNSVSRTTALPVPQLNGTPGAQNSIHEANVGPTYSEFIHGPVVPGSGQPVTVTALADDPDGVSSATLFWRTVSGSSGAWQTVPMTVAADGTLSGNIPGHSSSTVVQFYVEATDGLGATSTFPRTGPESRALYKVQDNQAGSGPQHRIRIIQATEDINFQLNQIDRMSNHRFGGTIIFNENEVFYDVGIRLKGSPTSRPSDLHGYHMRFHSARKFLGVHQTIAIDRNGVEEFLIKHLNNRADDVPSMYNDAVYLIDPGTSSKNGVFQLRLAGYSDVYLEEQFRDGATGMLIEREILYRPNGTDGGAEGRKLPVGHHSDQGNADIGIDHWGTDKEAYRLQWRTKNNRNRDDLSQIVELNEVFRMEGTIPDDQWNDALNEVINVDQWLRVLASTRLAGVGDFYGQNQWNHNYLVYLRPDTGQLWMLPWDLDWAFWNNAPLEGSGDHPTLREMVRIPENLRLIYGHYDNLIDTVYNSTYANTWSSHFDSMFPGTSFSYPASYIGGRASSVASQLPAQIPFQMTTSGPLDVGSDGTATIQGTGWVNVREIRLAGTNLPLDVNWTVGAGASYAQTWDVTLSLISGTNNYTVEAYDFEGNLIDTATIQITTTGSDDVIDSLRITEINYNPADPTAAELVSLPTLDHDDFEFIAVQNIGAQNINLAGTRFTDGIEFTFPNVNLAPGEQGVIVQDSAAFQLRYGSGLNVLGEFASGRLANSGENLTIVDGQFQTILDFTYQDSAPWPDRADGDGATLELIDPANTPAAEFGKYYRWRGSTELHGTPGTSGAGFADVVINEVLAHTEAPIAQSDSIELFNTTGSPLDVGGWYLSDAAGDLLKYEIPAGTSIPAGGYLVFDEADFNPNPGVDPSFALSGSHGDSGWLVNPNGGGPGKLWFVDDVHFGASANGESWGRTTGGSNRLSPMDSLTLGAQNTAARVGPLVISEINYHPPNPSPAALAVEPSLIDNDLEFVEVYNPTPLAVDLTDWRIRGGVSFDFAAGTMIAAGHTLVVVSFDPNSVANTSRLAAFRIQYGIDANVPLVGDFQNGGQLNNSVDRIELQRPDSPPPAEPTFLPHLLEDEVLYDDLAPWPTAADGSGESLQRSRVDLLGKDAGTWVGGHPSPARFGPVKSTSSSPTTLVIGETGVVTGVTHLPQTITFSQTYTNPIVLAQPASINGTDPVVVRATNVQSNQFDIFLTEPSNLNQTHGVGETVSFLVLEAGSHVLADGRQLDVGTVVTGATVGKTVASPSWETVSYATPFLAPPVVVTQPQTFGGMGYLSTRQDAITAGDFQVALQQEEMITSQHGAETVGYVAIEPGVGTWNGLLYEAQSTADGFTEVFTPLNFIQSFAAAPRFVSSLGSYIGDDNAHLRYQQLQPASIELKVEEDTTVDTEITHTAESVAYLAIGGDGSLTAVDTTIPDGLTQAFTLNVSTIGQVADLDVYLELVHGQIEDLDVFLEAPDSTLVELLSDVGGAASWLRGTTFDDEAGQSITSGTAPFSGHFQPESFLSDFDGKDTSGTWTLHVTDDTANGQDGTLVRWSLQMELAPDPPGNLNHDGAVDATDIDLLFANFGSADPTFDVDVDGDVDRNDVDQLVLNVMGKRFGDSDLDQDVDITDFNTVVINYDPLGQNVLNSWSMGNLDGDGDIDVTDLLKLVTNFAPTGYTSASAPISSASDSSSSGVEIPASQALGDQRAAASSMTVSASTEHRHVPADSALARHPFSNGNEAANEHLMIDEYFRHASRRRRMNGFGREATSLD